MVWIDLIDRDAVAEFNPFTEKFTEFPLPSRGIGSRHITVDNRSDIPDVWLPENRLDKGRADSIQNYDRRTEIMTIHAVG